MNRSEKSRRVEPRREHGTRRADNARASAWLLWLLMLVFAAAAAYGIFAWRKHASAGQVRAGLPVPPDLAGKPAVLGERLAQAEAKARSSRAPLDGVQELGRLYHANGYSAEAGACWRLMLARQSREPRWRYYLSDLRRAEGDNDEAAALLRATLELAPDYSPAHLHLANLQLKTGDFDGAERDYRRRLTLVPRDPYARLGLVRIALQKGRADEARTLLEELLKDAPNFSTAHNLYAEILAAAGEEGRANWHRWLGVETLRYTEPEDPWMDELQSWCHDYDRLCVLGSIESQRENHEQARVLYERALQLNPAAPDAYQLLSALHLKRNDAALARDVLEQARTRVTSGNRTPLFTYLCRAYRLLQQPAEAEKVARQGLAQLGDSAELLESLGLALADLKRHQEAVDAYEAALARNPNDASINYNLAVSLLSLRRLDDVLAALDRSLTLQPTFPPTLRLRGRIEMAAGHWEEAEKYLRPVFESHPEDAEARRLLAEWHRHMGVQAEGRGDVAGAERHYRDGLTIDPEQAELQIRLGVLYLAHRRYTDALEPLEAFHRLQPEDPRGCLYLGRGYAASGRRDEAREILGRGAQLADKAGDSRLADACRETLRQLR